MNSALYRGWVRHERRVPVRHAFVHRLFMAYLDLAEIDEVFRGRWLWSVDRPNLAAFWRRDYFGPAGLPLDSAVRDRVENDAGERPEGPIRLLTCLRFFGYSFNPVSFYYCFAKDGERLEAILAEITNTPWGERHAYVLSRKGCVGEDGRTLRWLFDKAFHVSPFMGMNVECDWRFSPPSERLDVHMHNREDGERTFGATLSLERRPLGARSLAGALLRHPFMTGEIVAAIYWQALRLHLKRAPFFPHPGRTAESGQVSS